MSDCCIVSVLVSSWLVRISVMCEIVSITAWGNEFVWLHVSFSVYKTTEIHVSVSNSNDAPSWLIVSPSCVYVAAAESVSLFLFVIFFFVMHPFFCWRNKQHDWHSSCEIHVLSWNVVHQRWIELLTNSVGRSEITFDTPRIFACSISYIMFLSVCRLFIYVIDSKIK